MDCFLFATGIVGELGPNEMASFAAITNVVNKQGLHTLVKNKVRLCQL